MPSLFIQQMGDAVGLKRQPVCDGQPHPQHGDGRPALANDQRDALAAGFSCKLHWQIRANRFRTVLVLAAFGLLVIALGGAAYALGGTGVGGLVLVVGLVYGLFAERAEKLLTLWRKVTVRWPFSSRGCGLP